MTFSATGEKNPHHKAALKRYRRLEKLQHVAELLLKGLTQPEISRQTGISLRTTNRYIQENKRRWLEQNQEDTGELVALVHARQENIFREAMAAWERSQQNKEIRTVEKGSGDKGKDKATLRTEGQDGDMACLNTALKALEAIRELHGLDAPKKTEITGALGILNVFEEIVTVRNEQNPTPPHPSQIPG